MAAVIEPEMTGALPLAAVETPAGVHAQERPLMTESEFRAFHALTARPLKAYLTRMTGNATLADDLLQEAYYRLLRSEVPAMEAAQRKNYLYRIATNLARDHFRAAKFQAEPLEDRDSGVRTTDAAQLSVDVQRVLNEIKPNERELVWLAYVEGASHREIASVTGLKEASVRPLLFRVKQKLAALLRARGLRQETER